MKTFALGLALCSTITVRSQVFQSLSFKLGGVAIPDGDALHGAVDSETVSHKILHITQISVGLTLSAAAGDQANNGDFYVTLEHNGVKAVLMNRVGKSGDSGLNYPGALGYPDNGVSVIFADNAANGDIHVYRQTLFGNANHPVDPNYVLPLTGTWAPDGRDVSFMSVLPSSPRTATLNLFNHLDASGPWVLYVADASSGGTATLDQWSLNLTGTAVPEPTLQGLEGLLLLAGGWLIRRSRGQA